MRSFVLLSALALVTASHAEIAYEVECLPDSGQLAITMRVPKTDRGAILQIPNWAPGAYVLRDNFQNVQNLTATDGKGNPLSINQTFVETRKFWELPAGPGVAVNKICTWQVAPARETVLKYTVSARHNLGAMHWSGPSTYLYEVNRKDESCKLTVKTPAGWQVFAGLDETRGPATTYKAPDYDVLADNPVTAGHNLLIDRYTTLGKPHVIVMRGIGKDKVDRQKLITACRFVTEMQTHFFGNHAPYSKYIWHFDVNEALDGAGGLEHLSSTQITLAAGVGPRAVGVISHEFFHLWNVKRIRSAVLGPFDYTKLPTTGALWWLEGVTDYYAYTLLHRYGWTSRDDYFGTINRNIQAVTSNAAFTQVSPHESSLRVAEASNGRGNSNGYRISYYNLGWVAGMCLDLEIRTRSNGRYSLDDVTNTLWDMCRDNKPGFAETAIRDLCIRYGGPGMADAYDRIVMQPNMPLAASLELAGMEIATVREPYVDPGFSWNTGPGVTAIVVTETRDSTVEKLKFRDTILAINGKKIEGEGGRALQASMTQAMAEAKADVPVRVTIQRGEKVMEVEVVPFTAYRERQTVALSPDATPAQQKIGAQWLAQLPESKRPKK